MFRTLALRIFNDFEAGEVLVRARPDGRGLKTTLRRLGFVERGNDGDWRVDYAECVKLHERLGKALEEVRRRLG